MARKLFDWIILLYHIPLKMTLQIHSLFYLLIGNLTRIDLFFPFAVKSSAEAPRRGIRTSCSWRWTNHGERSEQHCLVGRELQHHNNVAGKDRLQYQAQDYLNDCVNAVPEIPCYKYYSYTRIIIENERITFYESEKYYMQMCPMGFSESVASISTNKINWFSHFVYFVLYNWIYHYKQMLYRFT